MRLLSYWLISVIMTFGAFWATLALATLAESKNPERVAMLGAILMVAFTQDIRHTGRKTSGKRDVDA